MAKVKDNLAIQGISGNIGKLFVYKQVNGKTIITKMPNMPKTRTAKQKEHAQLFKAASSYAKNALLVPALKDLYATEAERRGIINAYNMALSDYMKAPQITHINPSAYTGKQIGELITIEVNDNFKVISVQLTIAKDNKIIEQGNATLTKGSWQYHTTTLNTALLGTKIIVTATDRPAHTTTEEITL